MEQQTGGHKNGEKWQQNSSGQCIENYPFILIIHRNNFFYTPCKLCLWGYAVFILSIHLYVHLSGYLISIALNIGNFLCVFLSVKEVDSRVY